MATRIDTLKTYEAIAAAGVDDKAARAISNAIADSASDYRADLATKADLEGMKSSTKSDFDLLRKDFESLGLRIEGLVSSAQNKTLVWMFGMMATFTGIILAGVKLL